MKIGARTDAPTVSAGMATPLLVFSGIAIRMLVDQRLDASLLTMFLVEYQPGGVIHPHDHPFEETYYILDGEVEAVADGRRYVLKRGDVFGPASGRSMPSTTLVARRCVGWKPKHRSRQRDTASALCTIGRLDAKQRKETAKQRRAKKRSS